MNNRIKLNGSKIIIRPAHTHLYDPTRFFICISFMLWGKYYSFVINQLQNMCEKACCSSKQIRISCSQLASESFLVCIKSFHDPVERA